ncbi:SDR family oxidoreductase [Membranicola marinus]|uniref:SDR family oxidoreductase n=1 Tax=Membranihabitans marinus TaxID=1227546 RepID=A0A953HUB4_9BACT|nr:SDR family oxidoreductase [Membranihabitans marinus]MBY5958580.1 SDR family oxidoreductase [Membranihabitans marinus]
MVREFADKNEWAVILGASSGLGLATAKKLAAHGLNLCLLYRARRSEQPSIEATFNEMEKAHSIRLIHFNADVVKVETRTKATERMKEISNDGGKIKALVHSIAKGNLKPMVSESKKELGNDDFHLTLENMAISLYDWTKSLFDAKLFSEDARIVSFTSEGNTRAWRNYGAISTAKVALEAITRSIALEFASYGIRANCIQAGMTDTSSFRRIPGHEMLRQNVLKRNPFHRMTTPNDVANVVYLLLKEEARWINGAIIPVDGGEHLS